MTSEGSDDAMDVSAVAKKPNGDVDGKLVDGILGAFRRLQNRGFLQDETEAQIYVGERSWRRLAGDSYDLVDKTMQFHGVAVVKWDDLPENRVIVWDRTATKEVQVGADVKRSRSIGEGTETFVTPQFREVMARPDAVEFVPEAEVDNA